jgi:hypothetical protein
MAVWFTGSSNFVMMTWWYDSVSDEDESTKAVLDWTKLSSSTAKPRLVESISCVTYNSICYITSQCPTFWDDRMHRRGSCCVIEARAKTSFTLSIRILFPWQRIWRFRVQEFSSRTYDYISAYACCIRNVVCLWILLWDLSVTFYA